MFYSFVSVSLGKHSFCGFNNKMGLKKKKEKKKDDQNHYSSFLGTYPLSDFQE